MFFRKKKSVPDHSQIVRSLVACIVKDEALGTPVYLPDVRSERDADNLGVAPVIYIWNEDRRAGSFTVSVNGKAVAHLLEGAVPRSDPRFNPIRDEVMKILADNSRATVLELCESFGAFPSDIFAKPAK
jgi:hypothetical protein